MDSAAVSRGTRMRRARGSGTLASSSGIISAAVIFGFAPSSIRTPARISTGTSSFTFSASFL